MDAITQLIASQNRSAHYEGEGDDVDVRGPVPVKLLAFYLPQFHPIPENDAWWGKGFTEWTNVAKAVPRFPGHYQPHLPADLGFYDLRLADTLRAQAALARRYGIEGFCFHWYWFAGKRLLETPLQTLIAHPDIELPFFINWANENWTRRWDGQEKTVLIAQNYSPDDDLALADGFLELMADRRYIRIDGRPLLMLYRPSLLPDAAATVARWRARFAERGERDPYLLMAHGFDDLDPRPYGIDAAVQYPPHNMGPGIERVNDLHAVYDETFSGNIFRFDDLVERMVSIEPDFPFFRGVCPGWDNEARRPNGGSLFVGATPRKYGEWLARTCQRTFEEKPENERLVFVNAWNEWGEGAYLEPDRHLGHAYLRETARALRATGDRERNDAFVAERAADARDSAPARSSLQRLVVKARRKIVRTLATNKAAE